MRGGGALGRPRDAPPTTRSPSSIRARAATRLAHHRATGVAAEAFGRDGRRVPTTRTASRSACPRAASDFVYGDAFPHEADHGPARRRRFRQGLLCRPGGRLAHAASRHGAHPHRAGRVRRRFRPPDRHRGDGGRTRHRQDRLGRARPRARAAPPRPRRRRARGRRIRSTAGGLRAEAREAAPGRASPSRARTAAPRRAHDAGPDPPSRRQDTAAAGRAPIRSTSPITTRNGACRSTTTAPCSRS